MGICPRLRYLSPPHLHCLPFLRLHLWLWGGQLLWFSPLRQNQDVRPQSQGVIGRQSCIGLVQRLPFTTRGLHVHRLASDRMRIRWSLSCDRRYLRLKRVCDIFFMINLFCITSYVLSLNMDSFWSYLWQETPTQDVLPTTSCPTELKNAVESELQHRRKSYQLL